MIPLNAYKHGPVADKCCRRCGNGSDGRQETLPHHLNHCMRYSSTYKARHNAIVERLKNAARGRWSVLREDQRVGSGDLRPDLVLQKGNEILIIDVTVPIENEYIAFDRARQSKEEKYTDIARELSVDGKKAKVEAVSVGSLGSWDPKNDRVIKRLFSEGYANLMRKIVVSETITHSSNIYYEHISGTPHEPIYNRVNI